jgi:hypothetical protein
MSRFRPTDAFVDESIRGQRYLMGCVLIEARYLAGVRPAIAALGVAGTRVHFNNESTRQRTRVLTAIADMPIRAFVTVCQISHGVTQFRARACCLERIVDELQSRSVGRLVVESRQDDSEDERLMSRVRAPEPRLVFGAPGRRHGADAVGGGRAHLGGRRGWALADARRASARGSDRRSAVNAQNPVPLPSGRQPGPLPRALAQGKLSMHPESAIGNGDSARRAEPASPSQGAGNRVNFRAR